MFEPICGGIPRRTLCCRTRCGSHFHSYGFAPWSPQSFLSSRARVADFGSARVKEFAVTAFIEAARMTQKLAAGESFSEG